MTGRAATIAALYETVRTGDLDAVTAYFAPDCTFVDIPTGVVSVGHAAFREYMLETWASFPDFSPEEPRMVEQGDVVGVQLVLRGTHRGDFAGVSATGIAVEWQAAAFYEFDPESGLIATETYYYDVNSILAKLQEDVPA